MSWSIKYEEGDSMRNVSFPGRYVLIQNQEPRVLLVVPEGHEADAMSLVVALEQAKAKVEVLR